MTHIEEAIVNETEAEIQPKTRKQKLWNIVKTVLKIGVTSALLVWVFSKVPIKDVKDRLLHANYWYMLAALVCVLFSMVVSASRLLKLL